MDFVTTCPKELLHLCYAGPSSAAPSLGRACGQTLLKVQSTGNEVLVMFISDSNVGDKGYRIKYKDIRKGTVSTPKNVFHTWLLFVDLLMFISTAKLNVYIYITRCSNVYAYPDLSALVFSRNATEGKTTVINTGSFICPLGNKINTTLYHFFLFIMLYFAFKIWN